MVWSDRITHLDRGDLIQIAAPDASSKRIIQSAGYPALQFPETMR